MKVKSLSRDQLIATSWTAAYQAPPSTGLSRQEYWNGLLLPSLTQVDTAIYVGMGTDRNNGDSTVDVCVYKDNAGTDGLNIYINMMGV